MTGHQGSGIGGSTDAHDQVDRPTLEVDTTTVAGPFRITARFTAGPGITALFGPSGSGKSVTLSTVAGLLRPQQGSITLHGVEVANAEQSVHVRTQDRHVSMVFQQAALLPHRSPLDNIALAVRREDREARRAEAADWLERVYGGQLAHARTRSLSGGEQQRVALARALAGKPRLLLLDEPFSALDLPTRTDLRVLLRELVDTHQLTALLVTHDLEDIAHLADRVVLFEPRRTTGVVDVGNDRSRLPALLGLS